MTSYDYDHVDDALAALICTTTADDDDTAVDSRARARKPSRMEH